MLNEGDGLSLFEKNRQAFASRFPDVWALGESAKSSSGISLVFENGKPIDVDVGGVRLYQEPAEVSAEKQVQSYFENPDRIGFADPAHCNLSPISKDILEDIKGYIKDEYKKEIASYPVVDSGFCFVFGIGLGHHIKPLMEQSAAKMLVLIEPQPALLGASFDALDWEELFQAAEELSINIRFIVGTKPDVIVRVIERLIWEDGQTFLEGSYAFVHYPSWELLEARKVLNEKLPVSYLSSGFYEDELLMMANTYGNLHGFPLSFLERSRKVAQDFPVFIVGSGPSLDKDIEVVKKWRNKALIFSCGTSSLGILLKNGIVPDFHGENENSWPLVENLRKYAEQYDLSPITYVASTSVNPEASKLFTKRWFYYRMGLSATASLNQGHVPLLGADPLVANSAFASMISLGFSNFYFFGVDCGRRTEHGHHAGEAIYYEDDYDNYLEGESFELLENEFNRVVPANFGGEALTTWYLDMSRASFALLCQRTGIKPVNCSDGAKIDGAIPKASAALKFDGPEGFQERLKENLSRTLPTYAAGEYLGPLDLQEMVTSCDRFEEEFIAAIDSALEEDESLWAFHVRMVALRDELTEPCRGVLSIIRSTFVSMIRVGAFCGTRIEDFDERRAFIKFFIEAYRGKVIQMIGDSRDLLSQMANGCDVIEGVAGVGPD